MTSSPAAGRLALASLRAYARVAPTERGGFRLVRLARRLLPRDRWAGTFRTPDHLDLDLDLATYPDCCMAVGLYELDTYRALRRLLRPGHHFVDVGANVGYFTLLAARWVGRAGRVDAIEPDPANRQRLEAHLRRNGLADRVRVHAVAAADAPGTLELYHPADSEQSNHGQASIYRSLVPDGSACRVPAVRLDEYLAGPPPHVVKLDVEGAELSAIRGMRDWLASDRPPRLVIEHNPFSCAAAGYRPSDIHRALLAAQPRYRLAYIDWTLRRIDRPEDLDRIARQGNLLAEVA